MGSEVSLPAASGKWNKSGVKHGHVHNGHNISQNHFHLYFSFIPQALLEGMIARPQRTYDFGPLTLSHPYVDRGALKDLEARYSETRKNKPKAKILCIQGMPGVGKTQLAMRFATCNRKRFTRAWIITAKTRETIIEKYRAILRELRFYPETLGEIDGNPSYIVQRFRDWLNNNHKWLLIFDGVVDEDPFNYLPSHFEGTVLMTTQNRGFDTESFSLVVMNKMTDDEAVELVNKSIPSRSPITRGRAVQLAQTLGNLPIAISAFA